MTRVISIASKSGREVPGISPERGLFPVLRIDDDSYGTVVDQTHFHVRTEFPGSDFLAQAFSEPATESFVKRDRHFRPCRSGVGRSVPFFRAGKQSELTDEQN